MVEENLLREPVDRAGRLVALSLVAHAHKAAHRLTSVSPKFREGDAEGEAALHDFRVAIRRLRSWIGAFKPWLGGAVSRRQRRRLSRIADATSANRDATVQLEWLREERPALSARQRVGHGWLRERCEIQRRESSNSTLESASDFEAMVSKLERRLNVYRSAVLTQERPPRFGAILAERVLKASDLLQRRLAAIHDSVDVVASHRARIAAKRLRYVIEPVSELIADDRAIIETLKTLQDSLGDLHDVHVLADTVVAVAAAAATRPGLLRLTRRLHERGARAYASVERDWVNDAGASFFDRVRQLAAEIARRSSLGTEVERKYLLDRLPEKALDSPSVEIDQGYLPGEKLVERIRRVRSSNGTEHWFRTVKLGSGIERVEVEEEAAAELGRAMWRLTKGRRIHKRRYSIREADDVLWDVDEFLDRTLVVAEIELSSTDAHVELPNWLHAVMKREVTDEPEYANAHLAR